MQQVDIKEFPITLSIIKFNQNGKYLQTTVEQIEQQEKQKVTQNSFHGT